MAKRQQANLLLAGGVALCTGPVEGPLVIGVVVHPLAKVVSKVAAVSGQWPAAASQPIPARRRSPSLRCIIIIPSY